MANLQLGTPDIAPIQRKVFDESKTRFSSWHKNLTRLIESNSGKKFKNTAEQSITYWYIIGEMFFQKNIKKSEFINFFDGKEATDDCRKNKSKAPIMTNNTVRLLLGKMLHSDLIREENIKGEKFVVLTDAARNLFFKTINEWIITYDDIGITYTDQLEYIRERHLNSK